MIMDKHILKLSQFDHFLLQRALRLNKKDKDRKALTIIYKEHRNRMFNRLEAFKAKVKDEDKQTHGGSFYQCIFGEKNLCIQDSIYFDLLHSFEDPTLSKGHLLDLGLIDLFTKDKPDLKQTKSERLIIQARKKSQRRRMPSFKRCLMMTN